MKKGNVFYLHKNETKAPEFIEELSLAQVFVRSQQLPTQLFYVLINTDPQNPGKKPWIFVFYAAFETEKNIQFYSYDNDTKLFHLEMAADFIDDDQDCRVVEGAYEAIRTQYLSYGEPTIEYCLSSEGKP